MKPILFAALLLCASTSLEAQRGRGACSGSALDPSVVSGVVYRNCDVDRPARERGGGPRIAWTPSPSEVPAGGCFRAEFEFVVDSTGAVEPMTIRHMASNSASFAEAVRASLTGKRYEPARLEDRPVRQMVVHRATAMVRVTTPGAARISGLPRC